MTCPNSSRYFTRCHAFAQRPADLSRTCVAKERETLRRRRHRSGTGGAERKLDLATQSHEAARAHDGVHWLVVGLEAVTELPTAGALRDRGKPRGAHPRVGGRCEYPVVRDGPRCEIFHHQVGKLDDLAVGVRGYQLTIRLEEVVWAIDGTEYDAKDLPGVSAAIHAALSRAGIAHAEFGDSWCGYRSLTVTYVDGTGSVEQFDSTSGVVVRECVGAVVAA